MAISFDKQLKGAQSLNVVIRSLSDSVSRLASTFERVSESQKETVNYTRELEISQEKIGKLVGVQEEKQKSLSKVLEKQGTYYKNGLNYLKSWEQRLKALEKQTDSMLKKASYHFLGLGTKVLQKVGKQINNIFSLKGALKLLKIGIGTALGVFAGLVATVKSVGGLIYKHMAGAFRLVSNVVKTSSGLVLSFFRKIWDTITMGGGEIRQAVAEMAQAFGMFNRTAGQAMNFLQANRRDWYQMGLSIGEATKYVIEYNKAYGRLLGFGREAKAFYVENIKMSRALGLEAEQSAKLSRSLQESSMTLKDFAFSLVGTFGPGGPLESMGVMIPEVARDIADSVDQLALMNNQNKKTFIAGAVWVRQYGFAIKDLSGMMDKFDTLSSAAENVSKLNQMFGVSINAMEMLVDTDPAARLEKVQQKLLQAGKSWESMDYFQRKSLSSMMGLNAEQAQLVFSGKQLGKSRKEIAKAMEDEDKKQANSQKRQAEVMSAILAQLRASRGIMGSIMPIFYRVWMAFGKMFGGFLKGGRRGLVMFAEEWALGIKKSFAPDSPGGIAWAKMTKTWVKGWQSTMKSFGKSWGEMWANIDMEKFGKDFYGTIDTAISAIKQIINELFPDWAKSAKQGAVTLNDVIHGIAERLQGIIRWIGENGADIIKGIGRVASATFNITKKVFQFFDKSNWGAAAVVMKDLFSTITQDMALILGYVDKTTGKMLNGFDPALAAAKGLQSTYMFMRDIVIDINKWWKKNGDEVKNFFKSAFETAKPWLKVALAIGEKTGAVIKAIGTFLAKNPALIGIIASFKAASFVSKGLTGMSLGQIGGGLLGKGAGTGIQQVRVVNAAEIGMAAGGMVPDSGGGGFIGPQTKWGARWSAAKQFGGQAISRTGSALGRGMLGGGLGYAAGSLLESAGASSGTSTVAAGLGAGIGAGSAFGPIGIALGAVAGGLFSFNSALNKSAEETRKMYAEKILTTLNKSNEASIKQFNLILDEKNVTEMFVESLKDAIGVNKSLIEQMNNETNKIQEKSRLDLDQRKLNIEKMKQERKAMGNKTLEEREARELLRKKIIAETKEINRRHEVNEALDKSIGNQDYLNALRQIEIDQTLVELELKTRTAGQNNYILQNERELEQAKINERNAAQALFDELQAGPKNVESWAKTGIPHALIKQIESLELAPSLQGKLQEQIIRTQDALRSGLISPDEAASTISKLYSDLQTQVSNAIDSGSFDKAMQLQQNIATSKQKLGELELKQGDYQLKVLKVQRDAAYIRAQAEIGPPNGITPEEASARLSALSPPSPPSMYAFGGLVKQATNALIGEAGPELVVPMRQGPVSNAPGTEAIVSDYLNKVKTNKGSEDHVIVVPINISGRKLGEALVKIAHQSV